MNKEIELLEENDQELIFECPVCMAGKITIEKQSIKKYGYCDVCDATYIHYIPLPHQVDVHRSKSRIKLLIGGVGSAKSDNAVMEIVNHALTVPNGYTMMLAQTLKQLGAAIMPKFLAYLPDKYIDKWSDTLATKKIVLTNGHIIEGFASDNEEKFRSLNTTAFYLEEASGIAPAVFRECLNRLRNPAGVINGEDQFLGLVVSNPSQGFIRDLLFEASAIHGSASIKKTVNHYMDRVVNPNPELEAFLSSSRDNPYLPKGFIDRIISSSTPAQVKLYIDCIIEYAEGAVYPEFLSYVVDDREIPDHWTRYLAHDPGEFYARVCSNIHKELRN